ncbi:MAG TPA: hypothetical protein VFN87_16380 [Solirubrobacteraceae bacterium]|nr:hypothetical protein [Solirubrobacteraceae bacterium]
MLATDIRFASEKGGLWPVRGRRRRHPRRRPHGPPAWSAAAARWKILLGGDDVPAALAAEYGYVNRVIQDVEIEGFTEPFARRIAAFDKAAVAGIKKLVDVATLPEDDELAPGSRRTSPPPAPAEPTVRPAAAQERPPAARLHRDRPRRRDREAATEPLTAGRLPASRADARHDARWDQPGRH